ncbi:MAG TPA: hypothetical protein VHY20_00225, partial [Pirellulales bacterium]|nr:hypothetical protein [Pirellulales bacterium]
PEKKREKKSDAVEPRQYRGEYHLFVARVGRRFLLVHNWPDELSDEEEAEADTAESLERCRQLMARLIERHRRPGEPSSGLRAAMADPPGDGVTLFELYGNLPLAVKDMIVVVDEGLRDAKEPIPDYAKLAWEFCKASSAVGPFVVRGSLHENRWERTVRVGLPAEHSGLLKLFDAGVLPAEPPAWVPATAESYSQINLDATSLAEPLREILQAVRRDAEFGPTLAVLEKGWNVDLVELIAGLGPRMMFVDFADPPAGQPRVGPKEVIVWQVRNEASWQKALQAAAGSYGLKLIERDGYVGMRIPLLGRKSKEYQSSLPWLLAGHDHLLWITGDDPTGPPLAQLPQPAVGDGGFRDSQAFRRAAELFPGENCFAYQCTDRSSTAETKSWLNSWISQLAKLQLIPGAGPNAESKRTWSHDWWSRLLGDEAEKALLTVEADRMTIEPDAIVHRAVLEFVPPER